MVTTTAGTLAQVFAAEEAGVPITQIPTHLVAVPLEAIVPCRWQPRQQFDPVALLDLANDIAMHGVLTPPLVWQNEDSEYELIAGERRVRACYALCLHGIRQATSLQDAIERVAQHGFVRERENFSGRIATSGHPQSTIHCRQIWGTAAELPCQHIAQPPQVDSYDNVVARTWQSGNTVIGRCRFYRLVAPHRNLPDLPGAGPALSADSIMHLLKQLCLADYNGRHAPGWFDAKQSARQSGPAWSEAAPVLEKLLATLMPGQRLALMYLWIANFPLSGTQKGNIFVDAFLPELGRTVPYHMAQDFTA